MARTSLRRTSVLALTSVGAGVGIFMAASPASADIFSQIRQCESGGNYGINTGNGFYGAYQFALGTWQALGYSGLPSDAPPAVQDQAAQRLAATGGFGNWPVCGAGGGSYSAPAQTYSQPTYTQPSYQQPSYQQPAQTYNTYSTAASRDYQRPAIQQAPVVPVIPGVFSTENVNQVRFDVIAFQKALVKRHYNVKVDGQYGPQTQQATLEFQKAKHLKQVDGVVGPETWKAAGLKPIK